MMLPKYISCWLLLGFLYSSSYAQDDPFDDPDVNPFDWLKEIDETEFDEEGAEHHIDQRDWKKGDWQDQFKEHEALYNEKNATEKRAEAYQLALQEGINMPQRYGQLTYDPESENVYIESDQAYTDRLHGFLETLEDELSEEAKILALEALYVALEPVLTALKAKNAAILDAIIPPMGGVPAYDPVEENVKEKREGKEKMLNDWEFLMSWYLCRGRVAGVESSPLEALVCRLVQTSIGDLDWKQEYYGIFHTRAGQHVAKKQVPKR